MAGAAAVAQPWRACAQPQYYTAGGYEHFLFDLYGCDYNNRANLNNGQLQQAIAPSLLKQEADLAFPTNNAGPDAANQRTALAISPFSVNGFTNPATNPRPAFPSVAAGHGWTYLEVAYRIRFLFTALYKTAEGMSLANSVTEVAPEENYLDRFFTTLAPDTTLMNSIFPRRIRRILSRNENVVRSTVGMGGDLTSPHDPLYFNPTSDSILQDPNFLDHLPHGPGTTRELAVPYSQTAVIGPDEGPIGPVSLEVAFILALQFAGISLHYLSRSRRAAGMAGPPKMYTAAQFAGKHNQNNEIIRAEPAIVKIKDTIHTTIVGTQDTQYPVASIGVGVYAAIDVFEGFEGEKGLKSIAQAKYDAKRQAAEHVYEAARHAPDVNLPNTAANKAAAATKRVINGNELPPSSVFSFNMHAVDKVTAETTFDPNALDVMFPTQAAANAPQQAVAANTQERAAADAADATARPFYVWQRVGERPAAPSAQAEARPYPTPQYFPNNLAPDTPLPAPHPGAPRAPTLRAQDLRAQDFHMLSGASAPPNNAPRQKQALGAGNQGVVKAHCHQGWWDEGGFRNIFTAPPNTLFAPAAAPKYEEVRKRHMYLAPELRANVHPRARRMPFV